jgi:iron complex outermembrane receptor protein
MKSTNYSLFVFAAIIFSFFIHMPVFAQDVQQAENEETEVGNAASEASRGSKDEEAYKLHNITVTAQKREQKIQDVPASVTALNLKEIEDAGIKSTADIHAYVPNLTSFGMASGGIGFSYYGMRGQTNFNSYSNSVGIYVDDIPMILSCNMSNSSLWEVEQIEVLRGPQGNLYGLSSSGGIINITTRKPENFWTGKAGVLFGNYDRQEYQGYLSGPISDTLFFSVSGTRKQEDSYVEEEGKEDRGYEFTAGRVQIKWVPTSDLDVLFSAETADQDRDFTWFTLKDDDPYVIPSHNHPEYDRSEYTVLSLKIEYETPLFDLVSITGNTDLEQEVDMEMFSGGAMTRSGEEPTSRTIQELRLLSNDETSSFEWMVGGFFQDGTEESMGVTEYYGMTITDLEGKTEKKTYSIFGQASYAFTEKLTATAGLRYDNEKQEYKEHTDGISTTTMMPYTTDYDMSDTWSSVSPRLSVDYRIKNEVMVYASAAKGYKAGGFTSGDAVDKKYDQEEVMSYELGVKTNWLDDRLIFNLCGFYTNADDLQTFYYDANYQFRYENTAEAVMYGVETELVYHPVESLEFSAPIGYVHSEIKEHETASLVGNKVPMTPEYTVGLSAQYTHATGFFMRGEWNMVGQTYYDEENAHGQDAYGLLNAKLGYNAKNFSVSAFIKNALDKEHYTYIYDTASMGYAYDYAAIGTPQTFGAEVTIQF